MRFLIVNDRRLESNCAYCCEAIGESYLRERATRIVYCGVSCFGKHTSAAANYLLEHFAREVC